MVDGDKHNLYFAPERKKYAKYKKLRMPAEQKYALGTFLNTDLDQMKEDVIQLYPTESTVEKFDALRKDLGDKPFDDAFEEKPELYFTENKSIQKWLSEEYDKEFFITGEGAELLDDAGNVPVMHTLRLVEAVDDENNIWYVLLASEPVLEYVNASLVEDDNEIVKNDLFFIHGDKVSYTFEAMNRLMFALAQKYFERDLQGVQVTYQEPIFHIDSDFISPDEQFKFASGEELKARMVKIVQTNAKYK